MSDAAADARAENSTRNAYPKDPQAKRKILLEAIDKIAPVLRASGPKSEELGTLVPEAVNALRDAGMFKLKLIHELGGVEADPVTEMLVLENLAYHDLTSGWCTMVNCTAVASLGTFLPQSSLEKVFPGGKAPIASISFFPAGRATRDGKNFRLSGRWRFNSGIGHAELVVGGTMIEGSEVENGGKPIVMFSVFPKSAAKLYNNWGGVVGLKGTGSIDCELNDYPLPAEMTFIWDLLRPKPARGGPLLIAAVRLCRQGTWQRRPRLRAPRARRTGPDRVVDPRHVPLFAARRAADRAPLHRRDRSKIASGASPYARAL